jgi:hypothetical protein
MNKLAKFAAAFGIAAALAGASFAAPGQLFAYTDTDTTVNVPFNDSADAGVTIDATKLFDAGQLIQLQYGAMDLSSALKIKQVIAPDGVSVSIDSSKLVTQTINNSLRLELSVTNDASASGQIPLQVVLENAMTGQTYTVNVMLNATDANP